MLRGRCFLIVGVTIVVNAIFVVSKPNLIVLFTDEHNLRTLGCYRNSMKKKDAFQWGANVAVETPHIDRLASEGAIFRNMHAVAPFCTPSRASFMTGKFPYFTGADINHRAMNKGEITWAKILQLKGGYQTGYVGKWHLDGKSKPGFMKGKPVWGFDYTKYMFNRGHWKLFDEDEDGKVTAYDWDDKKQFAGKDIREHYATDFIFNKGKEFIKGNIENGRNFALMLSIPDPHGPNDVRRPYDRMYNDMTFKLPDTAVAAYNKKPAIPLWASIHTDLKMADEIVADVEADEEWQQQQRQYFGMVKLLDDKVGELMAYLKKTGQDDNTIVVFTSDHGDLMGEHGSYNKGKPYKTSAGIPMIIRWPDGIPEGKIVKTSYSSPDFAPTILSLMGLDISPYEFPFQGIDGSYDLISDSLFVKRKQVRFLTDSKEARWIAAIDREFKLVLSKEDVPWLFDLKADPEEMINYYGVKDYKSVTVQLQRELLTAMQTYKFPMVNLKTFYVDRPFCHESRDQFSKRPNKVCDDLTKYPLKKKCRSKLYSRKCAVSCRTCCKDSVGVIWYNKSFFKCADIGMKGKNRDCNDNKMKSFCPVTCGMCQK